MRTIILSPHLDDAALSLALCMMHWRTSGHNVVVCNCFDIGSFAVRPYSSESDDRVVQRRQMEDQSCLRFVQAERICLGNKDANSRGDGAPPFLPASLHWRGDNYTADQRTTDVELVDTLVEQIDAHLTNGDRLAVPLAIGGHIDHVIVRSAGVRLASERSLAFYEDLPYASWFRTSRPEVIESIVCEASVKAKRRLMSHVFRPTNEQIELKQALCDCYHTQPRWIKEQSVCATKETGEVIYADDAAWCSW